MQSLYFTEEHQLFRDTVRDFVAKEITPYLNEWEKNQQIPRSIWKKMGEMGFLGINHEEAYGGSALDFFYSVVWIEEISRTGTAGISAAVSVHQFMATNHLAMAGSPELKDKYLRPAITGDFIGAIAISEPGAGSNVAGVRTTAERVGDHFIVNGSKTFITNGYYADYITTVVKTKKGISLLVIDGNAEGVSRTKLDKLGWKSSDTGEIHFDSVKVPATNLVGEEGKGFYYIMDSFQLERLTAAIGSLGGMDSTMELTLQYMSEREAFGRKINKFQVLRHRMADLATEIEACRQFVYHTSWLFANGQFAVKQCTMVKLLSSELAKKVADQCLQSFGGYGFMEEYPLARIFRDSRVGTIVGGTSEIMREILAKIIIDDVSYAPAYDGEEVNDTAKTPKPEPSISELIKSLSDRFKKQDNDTYATIVHFNLTGDKAGKFTVEIQEGTCVVKDGFLGHPKCILEAEGDIYLKSELGEIDGRQAFMEGKIMISDIAEMMKFSKRFKKFK